MMTMIDEHGINRNLRVRYSQDIIYVSAIVLRRKEEENSANEAKTFECFIHF